MHYWEIPGEESSKKRSKGKEGYPKDNYYWFRSLWKQHQIVRKREPLFLLLYDQRVNHYA